ncbi:MAG: bifunctional ornithine acetyltransferase/N-acetylglutamate synthase, partial [Candidatus Altarchaeum sp.]|nr:bifunctional ornithine acetyltransferase/N-acetylglutamate synthase [Candidatus Altarchaeum sp.]
FVGSKDINFNKMSRTNIKEIKSCNDGVCINKFKANGIKTKKYGVALIWNENLCDCAAVFTKNSIKANPIKYDIAQLNKRKKFKAIIANSGNANACVREGLADVKEMCKIASEKLNINPDEILCESTGIIGKRMDIEKIRKIVHDLDINEISSRNANKAIMTTDTKFKEISYEYKGIKIGGICKGAGMIAPNMATMLCFLTTNANLGENHDISNAEILNETLKEAVSESFNMISVDGCMSTNDCIILLSDATKICDVDDFKILLKFSAKELAKKVVADGEGATKFLEVVLEGAKTHSKANKIALTIANSNLVKSAFFGENLNWGRIISAAGGVAKINFNNIDLKFENIDTNNVVEILNKGIASKLDDLNIMKAKNIRILLNLNEGDNNATAWGCDLTYDYVKINAEYN